jgi:tetratricopeptide (TPR) repeat protein
VALPSTGDITHLGALVQKGHIVVVGVTRPKSPSFFSREGLYFVDKTTGEDTFGGAVPMRVFSTQPPPARVAVEQQFDRLRDDMRPYELEIERLEGEILALHQEKYEQQWQAVIDSVPELVVYAREHFATGDKEGSARACTRIDELAPPAANPYVQCGLLAEQMGDIDRALARYGEALSRDSSHAIANRREALLLSRQQEDPFEEARLLLRYEDFDDPTAMDAQAVHERLVKLKEEWGHQARRACLAFDEARIDQVQWDAMNTGRTSRESVARNIKSCERAEAEARAQLQTLSDKLASINLDAQALMIDSRDDGEYWRSRSQQASALRQQIEDTENSLEHEFQEEKIPIHRERIRQYREILSEIEQEAKKVGVAL